MRSVPGHLRIPVSPTPPPSPTHTPNTHTRIRVLVPAELGPIFYHVTSVQRGSSVALSGSLVSSPRDPGALWRKGWGRGGVSPQTWSLVAPSPAVCLLCKAVKTELAAKERDGKPGRLASPLQRALAPSSPPFPLLSSPSPPPSPSHFLWHPCSPIPHPKPASSFHTRLSAQLPPPPPAATSPQSQSPPFPLPCPPSCHFPLPHRSLHSSA